MHTLMHKFTAVDQEFPALRPVAARRGDFLPIEENFSPEQARTQASRCEQCGVPFCQTYCPVGNDIPDWLALQAAGRLREAWDRLSAVNVLPEVCGRICPQDRLCEGNCVLERADHGTVTIGAVESFLTETAFAEGWVTPIRPVVVRGGRVGIVGAGPAGISAAATLRRLGYGVEIFDAYDRAGGLMIYGIPNFKLDKAIVQRRVRWLEESGVDITLNCRVGRDKSFSSLRSEFDAVLLATGVYRARRLGIEDEEADGCVEALRYLETSDRLYLGDRVAESVRSELSARARRVVVLGGGDTAMDCVRTAVRQQAESVLCLYRRDRAAMPGSKREVAKAEQEGVVFGFLSSPHSVLLSDRGRVCGLEMQRMRLGGAGLDGRLRPVASGKTERVEADFVIKALGFEPEPLPQLFDEVELPVTEWGSVRVEKPSMQSALSGVFAAGDIVRGASLVVWAVREGVDAAKGIHQWLDSREEASA